MTEELERTFTQEEVNKIVGDARVKARDIATSEADTQRYKDEIKAKNANLAAKEEWETLAKTHEARVKELEPVKEQIGVYIKFVDAILEGRVKELGDAAKSAVEGLPESMTSMDKLTWLNVNIDQYRGSRGAGIGTPTRQEGKPAPGKLEPGEISKFPIVL